MDVSQNKEAFYFNNALNTFFTMVSDNGKGPLRVTEETCCHHLWASFSEQRVFYMHDLTNFHKTCGVHCYISHCFVLFDQNLNVKSSHVQLGIIY